MASLRLAWRNLWRNRARTAIAGSAVALNTAILIVTLGLSQGMLEATVRSLTCMAVGAAQVHAPGYREERKIHQVVRQPAAILRAAEDNGIRAVARAYGDGLAAVGHKSSGASFWGVDPAREREAFDLAAQIHQGRYLATPPPAAKDDGGYVREVVLGRKLASTLQAKVGSELVAVVQAADGSIGNDLFWVVGILKTVSSDIDRSAAIIHQRDFTDLFVSNGRVHEIALRAPDGRSSQQVAEAIRQAASGEEVLTWQELAPGPAQMLDLFGAVMAIFGLIFAIAAGTGVMNSMLMSTFDRFREFGVLKALGATPWRILRDVATEAWLLGLTFGTAGAALGLATNAYLAARGLNLGTDNDLLLSGVAFDPIWRATVSIPTALAALGVMCLASILASLYPAAKAARLDPVVAMTEP